VTDDELEIIDPDDLDDDDDEEEADGDDGAPSLGGFDFSQLLEQAQNMQQQLLDAQAKAAEQVVEGQAGGGVVRITVTGGFDFQQVTIDKSVVDPDDVEMLQDLVLAAMRDALAKINDLNQEAMGGFAGGGAFGGLLS
jgi:DNA-binding YbaB/EbfC family protein